MRVVYKFGGFTIWDEMPDSKVGDDMRIMHPFGRLEVTMASEKFGEVPNLSSKIMEFTYKRRLDYDLVEYEFVGEK